MTFLLTNPDNETDGGTLELDGANHVVSTKVGNFTYVIVSGGVDDGISVFRLGADGLLTSVADATDDVTMELDGAAGMATTTVDGNTYLFVTGAADNGLSVFRMGVNGVLTNTDNFTDVGDSSVTLSGASRVATARVSGVTYVYVAGTAEDGIQRFSVSGAGKLTLLPPVLEGGTFELDGVKGLATTVVGGNTFLVAAGSVDDGVSVFQVVAGGTLNHIGATVDSGSINLNGASDVATTVVNGVTYVAVAGTDDNGISIFSMNSGGVLTHVQSVADTEPNTNPEFFNVSMRLTGASSVSFATIGSTTYLNVGGSESGISMFRLNNDGTLDLMENVDDGGSRELSGVVSTGSATVNGESFVLGAGATDDGVSTFGSGPTGQMWYTTEGGYSANARVGYVNNDGGNSTVRADNNPTVELQTGFVADVGLDTAANFFFNIVNGGTVLGTHALMLRGSITGSAAPVVVFDFPDLVIVNAMIVDNINELIYTTWQDDSGDATNAGIRKFSYNPTTGAVTDQGFLVRADQDNKPTEPLGGFDILDVRDFALDLSQNDLYFTELLTGGVQAIGLFRLDLATPNVITQVVSQAQFPDDGSNGYIIDVEVDPSTDLLYFTTESQSPFNPAAPAAPEYNAAHNAIWYINQGATGGTATQLTLIGLPGGHHLYPGDMTFDPATRQLYVETEEGSQPATVKSDDVVYVFQLNGAGTSATLINTIAPNPAFLSNSPSPNLYEDQSNQNGMDFNVLPTLSGLSGTATPVTEQGSAVVLLTATPTITDVDGDHLASATVQVTGGQFSSNETSANDDDLGIGAGMTQSGLIAGTNITIAWDQATSLLSLTGYDTLANYQNALATVRFQSSGNNPTNYGLNVDRTVTWTVSDGVINIPGGAQNSGTTVVNITAVNDAPINNIPGGDTGLEDQLFGINGVGVLDSDANPGIGDIVVTLSVNSGTLLLRTDIVGGLTAGDIANNGSGLVTVTATQNEINLTFANATGIQYQGNLNFFGNDLFTIVTNDQGLTGNDPGLTGTGTTEQDSDSFTITVTPVNDAPTGTIEDRTINEDQTYTFTLADFNDGFADVDDNPAPNSLNRVQVATLATDGVLMYDADGVGVGNAAVAVTLLQFISTADIAAGKFFFVPTANENDTTDYATFNFRLEDNGGIANGGVNLSIPYAFTFDVDPINDAPVVVGATQALAAINEDNGDPAGNTVSALFASHFDDSIDNQVSSVANNFAGVAVTAIGAGGGGVWQVRAGGSWVDLGAVSESSAMLLEGTAELRFLPDADFNGPAPSLTVRLVDDSSGAIVSGAFADVTTNGGTTQYSAGTVALSNTVNAVNDAPVASGTGAFAAVNEDDTPAGQTVSAVFTSTFSDATDQVAGGSSANTLAGIAIVGNAETTEGAWQWFDGAIWNNVGARTTATALTLASATELRFLPAANYNGVGPDLTVHLIDDSAGAVTDGAVVDLSGGGATGGTTQYSAATADSSLTVNSVNDEPSGADKTVIIGEDGSHTFAVADFGFSDSTDGDDLLAVTITTLPASGILELDGTAVTAGQSIAVADIIANKLVFTPAADDNGAGYASFTFQVQDDGGIANSGVDLDGSANTFDFDVYEVNDDPTASDDSLTAVDEDAAPITISFASLTGNDFAGPVNESGQTLDITGVANVVGGSAQIVGTDVIFTLDANFNGTASFDYTLADDGTTNGVGDPQTDVGSASFTVNSVNDAPAGADKTVNTNEDTAYTFAVGDFGFTDPDDTSANALLAVLITTLPGDGSLELSNVAVTAGQSIDLADITAGNLKFVPAANENQANYASFTFQVQDDGGIGSGGVDLDQSANTITIDVDPLNDDPNVDQGIGDQIGYFLEAFSFTFPADAFDDIDGDTLAYTAEIDGGGSLPAWLNFNAATREFSGTPAESDVGVLTIRVYADDGNGGTLASTVFDIDVTHDLLLFGTAAANTITGHHGDDTVRGLKGDDNLLGAQGKDVLDGQDGNDTLEGGGGGDSLQGADGNDRLIGGAGRDVYRGGDGDDIYVYDDGDIPGGPPRETIRDFVDGDDLIDLSAIDANGAGPGDTAFTWIGNNHFNGVAGEGRYRVINKGAIIECDLDGDGNADFQIMVLDATALDATDFVL